MDPKIYKRGEVCIHEVQVNGEWVVWQVVERKPDEAWNFQAIELMKPQTRFRIVKQRPHSIHCAGYLGQDSEYGFNDSKCDCGAMQ